MTHRESKLRRKQAADMVREGYPHESVAKQLGISRTTLAFACREYNVQKQVPHSNYSVIALLLKGQTPANIAKACNISKQRVYQIQDKCIKAGIINTDAHNH